MEEAKIWDELTDVFRTVFDDDEITLERGTTAKDVEDWDSVTNVELMVAVEERFGVRINLGEVVGLANVGQLVDLLKARTSGGG